MPKPKSDPAARPSRMLNAYTMPDDRVALEIDDTETDGLHFLILLPHADFFKLKERMDRVAKRIEEDQRIEDKAK
jgi:hypothetical protein